MDTQEPCFGCCMLAKGTLCVWSSFYAFPSEDLLREERCQQSEGKGGRTKKKVSENTGDQVSQLLVPNPMLLLANHPSFLVSCI